MTGPFENISAEEQSVLLNLVRLPYSHRNADVLWDTTTGRVLMALKPGSFADKVAHALARRVNRTQPEAIHYAFAIDMLRKMGRTDEVAELETHRDAKLKSV